MLKSRISAGMLLAAFAAFAQAPAAVPAFEVASIKPAPPLNPEMIRQGKMHVGVNIDAARVDIGFLSLADLICVAYKIKRHQLIGADSISEQRWDILAKMPEGATKEQVPEMLQGLLADRFKLKIHHENKELPVYALVQGKNGHKMKEAPADPEPAKSATSASADPGEPGAKPAAPEPPGKGGMIINNGGQQMRVNPSGDGRGATISGGAMGTMKMSMGENGNMHWEASKMSMLTLCELLSRFVDRPVIDQTELKGNYQVTLEVPLEVMKNLARAAGAMVPMGAGPAGEPGKPPAPAAEASDPSGSIFSSVQQLGLKLDARKSTVEMVAVDHAEKTPTEN